MEKMQRAFEIYPYCAMALNHLANHFFFTGQHFLVEQLTEIALDVSDHGLMKSHSYYNLAKSYHSKGDFEKAGYYYMAFVKESPRPQDFVLPYYGLGQVQLKLGDFRSSVANFEKVLEAYPKSVESMKAVGHIYVQLGQTDKALEILRKATKIDPRDAHMYMAVKNSRYTIHCQQEVFICSKLFEAAWDVANITICTSEHTRVLIEYGVVPMLVKILRSGNDDVREEAVLALGNIAGDSPCYRNFVLSQGALVPLLCQFNNHSKQSMLRNDTWSLSNFCRDQPPIPF